MSESNPSVADPQVRRFTFQGCYRLHTAAEFSGIFSHRRVLRSEHFALHFRPGTDPAKPPEARLGLVIAKKLARRAVLRNLIKRIARESFRHRREDLPGCEVILRLSCPLLVKDHKARRAWRSEIDGLLTRLAERLGAKGILAGGGVAAVASSVEPAP